ncbi:MAG TPA: LysR family transcriptional regulator [Conexibacter sp.]|nr:LysR family transcriptional regulator [Conexibacter sp.]
MELRQLRYLVALADERHFTRAAAHVNVAQPALSQQLRKLEAELGVPLVDRTTRSVRMTEAGDLLVAHARRALAELDDGRAELARLTGLVGGRVTIGLTHTPGPLDLVRLLAEFHARCPQVELAVREDLSTTLADALRADALDLAFLSIVEDADRRGLELWRLAEEPLVATLPERHRLAARTRVTLGDLREEDFVAFPAGATIRRAVARVAEQAGFAPRIAFETREPARARALVAAGLGVAVLPRSDAAAAGVRMVELRAPTLRHRISLCWRKGKPHAPAARALLELAQAS